MQCLEHMHEVTSQSALGLETVMAYRKYMFDSYMHTYITKHTHSVQKAVCEKTYTMHTYIHIYIPAQSAVCREHHDHD